MCVLSESQSKDCRKKFKNKSKYLQGKDKKPKLMGSKLTFWSLEGSSSENQSTQVLHYASYGREQSSTFSYLDHG